MKKRIITLLLSLLMFTGFAQDLNYDVHGRYIHSIAKEKLSKARSMGDIIAYYPTGWITIYVSAEIRDTP